MSGQLHFSAALPPSEERAPGTHFIKCSVGLSGGLGVIDMNKVLCPAEIEPRILGHQSRSLVAIPTELSQSVYFLPVTYLTTVSRLHNDGLGHVKYTAHD
jgi:hypothetical protein